MEAAAISELWMGYLLVDPCFEGLSEIPTVDNPTESVSQAAVVHQSLNIPELDKEAYFRSKCSKLYCNRLFSPSVLFSDCKNALCSPLASESQDTELRQEKPM